MTVSLPIPLLIICACPRDTNNTPPKTKHTARAICPTPQFHNHPRLS